VLLFPVPPALPTSVRKPPPVKHHVPEGFVIEQVAGEPEVVFPMFATFDDRGRLFVAESSGLDLYAELQAQTRKCRIRLLEDRDGTGHYKTSRVFADQLVFPMGLVWRDGKLYVADPPDLVVLEDTDGAGRANKRTVILSGFGHRDNGSLHGLTFGPDGLLYMTMGQPDGYRFKQRGTLVQGKTGALLRCRPDGSDPEVLCRGFENLVEIVFTPRGDVLGTDNWFQRPSGGIRDALVHLVEGGLYPLHADIGTPQFLSGPPLPAVSLFPAVALSGLMRYRGTAFPEALRGNLFSAQHNARKVGRHVLVPHGSTFRSEDHDFVTSDDPDFHPSDVLEAADGSLLVVDTGSWYVHHCPTGQIRKTRAPGGIYRVRPVKAAPLDDPWGLKIDWPQTPVDRLAALLADRRPVVRDRAQRVLSARGKPAIAPMVALLEGPAAPRTKQLALWALSAIAEDAALPPLRRALRAADDLAITAARTLALRRDRSAAPELARLLTAEPPVALAAAQALAHCGDAQSLPPLWKALAGQPDRFL
jgi:glucose/arabinose dehydrogenase